MEDLGGILSTNQKNDVYVISLVTILCGFSLHKGLAPKGRQYLGALLGVSSVILFCGPQGIFPLTTILVAVLWKLSTRHFQRKSTGIAFAIVIFLRVLFGLSEQVLGLKTHDYTVTNTLHMFVALRCVSVIYEITYYLKSKDESNGKTETRKSVISPKLIEQEPTITEFICYLLYAPAISLGPFYTYQTYYDSLHISQSDLDSIPRAQFLSKKLRKFVLLFGVLLLKSRLFDGTVFEAGIDKFANFNYFKQMAYIAANGLETSSFIALTWQLGESSCIAFGLGGYKLPSNSGQGPVKEDIDDNQNKTSNDETHEWNFDTISNGHGELWVFEESLTVMFREWNRTTQWWLARYCYTAPCIRKHPRLMRMFFTQFINVYWHGISPGYFISLMLMPIALVCEQKWQSIVAKQIKTTTGLRLNKLLSFTFNFVTMSYIHLAFSLGGYEVICLIYRLTFSASLTCLSCLIFAVIIGENIHRILQLKQ